MQNENIQDMQAYVIKVEWAYEEGEPVTTSYIHISKMFTQTGKVRVNIGGWTTQNNSGGFGSIVYNDMTDEEFVEFAYEGTYIISHSLFLTIW